ncbi:amino acid/amide ABC transporter membrane protein 2 (HAAT family) [Stella humosa]|uniref:Amino acid/amide ABC transporter membrane protein 2 (HAAT family) n=1 Tax=Stella humosa TaxID=94 RepID=A0A3N1KZL2_9PROT|nr:branched-chain amino acid ABC transporter permease [Stella humosa]ROP83758.1 amino acid/amide ABC transporter membrane protein 2 (HAAT family) [Stella humosa]BBK32981.1 branched-chain amino acid ABC transporter permease [Stella humosa]
MTPIAATMPARPRARRLGFLVVLLAFAVAGCALPFVVKSQLFLTLMTQAAINAVLATGVGFLVRQSGNVSFGHAAFFGLSAYATALLIKFGLPAEAAIVLAVLLPTLFALALGVVIVRVTGVAFSMLTLAVAQAFHELVLKWRELANGDDGMAIAFPSRVFGIDMATFQQPASMFLISWMTLVAIILGLWLLQRSHFGTLTLAIRENEERARYIGYRTVVPRAIVYAVSAAIASVAGLLFALYNGFVSPGTLHWSLSGEALIMAIIGGPRLVWGPALGGVIFFFIKNAAGDFTDHWPAVIGITLILVTVLLPRGVGGIIVWATDRLTGRRER